MGKTKRVKKSFPPNPSSPKKAKLPPPPQEPDDSADSSVNQVLQAKSHHTQAVVEGCIFNLYDYAHGKAEEARPDYIAKIVELFETINGELYFSAYFSLLVYDVGCLHEYGKYIQVGNDVAFLVSVAFGQMLAKANQGVPSKEPITEIAVKFPSCLELLSTKRF
ncbi:hypothetical protein RHSIM_Rhsim09G0202000 [Rhododendron simsii]|uniref:Uncharacterized protein n=1 Tax=Rhododendron simsii TaxID=118357 RepID=A0A834LFT8_RHOSS|nr:hypothetical protein RHSIM_Rhsim09G0202000 [Rhododendron simsii]